jgi:hypothetical protein
MQPFSANKGVGIMRQRIICVVSLVVMLFSLAACFTMSDAEKEKAKELVQQHATAFKEQAKVQYGSQATVFAISAIKTTVWHSSLPKGSIVTTGDLEGVVKVGRETFDARYIVEKNEIISQRNYDKIIDSLADYFGYLNLDIVGGSIINGIHETHFLPDSITSFKDMVENKEDLYMHLQVGICVTGPINHLDEHDFDILETGKWLGHITIIQVDNQAAARKLLGFIHSVDFNYGSYPDDGAYDKYNIRSAIHVGYDSRMRTGKSFYYVTKFTG